MGQISIGDLGQNYIGAYNLRAEGDEMLIDILPKVGKFLTEFGDVLVHGGIVDHVNNELHCW